MDGASNSLRGDAVAGRWWGIKTSSRGWWSASRKGTEIAEAARTYTLLRSATAWSANHRADRIHRRRASWWPGGVSGAARQGADEAASASAGARQCRGAVMVGMDAPS